MPRRLLTTACLLLVLATAAACGSKDEAAPAFTIPGNPNITIPGGAGSSTTSSTLASAAGKPCVAATDVPAAAGKPTVDVPVGPPPTTLQTTDVKVGDGAEVKAGDSVKMQYVGIACSTGKQFDSSWDRGQPFDVTIGAGQVIKGWDQGIPGMKVGGQRLLVIPADLAYGNNPPPGSGIAPGETLIFLVQADGVTPAAAGSSTTSTPAG
ncbi:MAG: FKBP-type peptidyl-prolyl cis-trans isomerase [Acidimicrobiales bacterium]